MSCVLDKQCNDLPAVLNVLSEKRSIARKHLAEVRSEVLPEFVILSNILAIAIVTLVLAMFLPAVISTFEIRSGNNSELLIILIAAMIIASFATILVVSRRNNEGRDRAWNTFADRYPDESKLLEF